MSSYVEGGSSSYISVGTQGPHSFFSSLDGFSSINYTFQDGDATDGTYWDENYNYIGFNATSVKANAAITASAVPEPATWAMMIVGFGAVGYSLRRQRKVAFGTI